MQMFSALLSCILQGCQFIVSKISVKELSNGVTVVFGEVCSFAIGVLALFLYFGHLWFHWLLRSGDFCSLRNQRVRFYGAGLEFCRAQVPHVQQPSIRCFRVTVAQILNAYFGYFVFLFNWLVASNIFRNFFHNLRMHPVFS